MKNLCCNVFSIFLIISSHYILLSGLSEIDSIPSLGVFLHHFAGVQISAVKWGFLHRNEREFSRLWDQLNQKDQILKKRSIEDPNIKRMRQSTYVQEILMFVLAMIVGVMYMAIRLLEVFFYRPIEPVYNSRVPFNSDFGGIGYWVLFFWQGICFIFNVVCIASTDVLIGNMYSQLILHFDVLNYDIEQLNANVTVTTEEMIENFSGFTKEFQDLQSLNKSLGNFLRPLFFYHIVTMMVAITFICIETGVLLNVDIKRIIPPLIYFLFMNIVLFYWCWLGNRLKEKVNFEGKYSISFASIMV